MDPSVISEGDPGWPFLLAGLAFLILFCIISYLIKKRQVQIQKVLIPWRLRRSTFFHSLIVGKSVKDATPVGVYSVWCDSTYTIIVKNAQGPLGIIGFELSKTSMKIYQLQGIKGVNIRGLDLGDHLLACAEAIARTLGKREVLVQPARFHTYYDLDEMHSLYPQLYKHQERLRKMYDGSARKRGYEYCRPGYSYWYQKVLRKRMSFKRWLHLQVLLFDRQMRNIQRDNDEHFQFAQE